MKTHIILTVAAVLISPMSHAKTSPNIQFCEQATVSNKIARAWELKAEPQNDSEYQTWINASPHCSFANGDKPHHKRILHHDMNGVGSEIQIHKLGEQQWIKNNWRTLRKECVVPRGLKLKRLNYRTPKPRSPAMCNVTTILNLWHNKRLHQWGVGKKKFPAGGKARILRSLKAGGGRRRR